MDEIFNFAKERMNAYSRRFGDVDIVPAERVVHCVNTCYGSCLGSCVRICRGSCRGSCIGTCETSCQWACKETCRGGLVKNGPIGTLKTVDPLISWWGDQQQKKK